MAQTLAIEVNVPVGVTNWDLLIEPNELRTAAIANAAKKASLSSKLFSPIRFPFRLKFYSFRTLHTYRDKITSISLI